MRKSFLMVLAVTVFGFFLCSGSANALTFEYDYVFSGDSPSGTAPWLVVTFDNTDESVRLSIDTSGLTDSEFIGGVGTGGLFFNFNPEKDVSSLNFVYSSTSSSGPAARSISFGEDFYQADGDGKYDIFLAWLPANNGNNRLRADKTVVYDITLSGGVLLESDFDFLSAPAGGSGPFQSAAFIQGIGKKGKDSGWIAPSTAPVPEPATMLLLGSGLIGLAAAGRRKFFKK